MVITMVYGLSTKVSGRHFMSIILFNLDHHFINPGTIHFQASLHIPFQMTFSMPYYGTLINEVSEMGKRKTRMGQKAFLLH